MPQGKNTPNRNGRSRSTSGSRSSSKSSGKGRSTGRSTGSRHTGGRGRSLSSEESGSTRVMGSHR